MKVTVGFSFEAKTASKIEDFISCKREIDKSFDKNSFFESVINTVMDNDGDFNKKGGEK